MSNNCGDEWNRKGLFSSDLVGGGGHTDKRPTYELCHWISREDESTYFDVVARHVWIALLASRLLRTSSRNHLLCLELS